MRISFAGPGRILLTLAATISSARCSSPAAPSCTDYLGRGETAFNTLQVKCSTVGSRLQCQSEASIQGLYVYCPMSMHVTSLAAWSVGDSGVARLIVPGEFEAAGVGDTFVRATWQKIDSFMNPVSVFAGTPPLPTSEIFGSIYKAGQMNQAGTIDGAAIQILDGLVAGRTSTSGVPPPLLPGYLGPFGGRGYYRLLGVPPGTYRLRVTKDGYASQERSVTLTGFGSPLANFELPPL